MLNGSSREVMMWGLLGLFCFLAEAWIFSSSIDWYLKRFLNPLHLDLWPICPNLVEHIFGRVQVWFFFYIRKRLLSCPLPHFSDVWQENVVPCGPPKQPVLAINFCSLFNVAFILLIASLTTFLSHLFIILEGCPIPGNVTVLNMFSHFVDDCLHSVPLW